MSSLPRASSKQADFRLLTRETTIFRPPDSSELEGNAAKAHDTQTRANVELINQPQSEEQSNNQFKNQLAFKWEKESSGSTESLIESENDVSQNNRSQVNLFDTIQSFCFVLLCFAVFVIHSFLI
jgi:hypothetical protein